MLSTDLSMVCEKHVLKLDTPPLSMIMTEPGGTGKMYVVNAVKAFMAWYGCAHLIHFLAPTGSAASFIDGMTGCQCKGAALFCWDLLPLGFMRGHRG
jgi:hypothetical protein